MWQMLTFAGAVATTSGGALLAILANPFGLACGCALLVVGLICLGFAWAAARQRTDQ